jgi:hypothetical protein
MFTASPNTDFCIECHGKVSAGICTSCGGPAEGRINNKGHCESCQNWSYIGSPLGGVDWGDQKKCANPDCSRVADDALGNNSGSSLCFNCQTKVMRGKCLKCGQTVRTRSLEQNVHYCHNCQ